MSLGEYNPEERLAVIDRTDDSAGRPIQVAVVGRPIQVAVVGRPALFNDAMINALLGSRISAWRVEGDLPPMVLLDLLEDQQPELVLLSIGMVEDDTAVQRLVGHLTQRKVPVVVLNATSNAALARRWIDAGAVAVVDPATAEFDDLAKAVRVAADRDPAPAGDWRRRLDEARRSAQARLRDFDIAPTIRIDDATH